MKRRDYLVKTLSRQGHTPVEIESIIADLEADIADDDANNRMSRLLTADEAVANDDIYKRVKGRATAEALDPIDAEFTALESAIPADLKAAYDKLGKSTYERVKFLTKNFAEIAKRGTGDNNFDELKQSYEQLKSSFLTDYVSKADAEDLRNKLASARQKTFRSDLMANARELIKDEKTKSDRRFEMNFLADFEDILTQGFGDKKIKGSVDYETGRIMRVDSPDQPLMLNNEVLTPAGLAAQVVAFGEWNKGYTPPSFDPITVPINGAGGKKMSSVMQRTLELERQEG